MEHRLAEFLLLKKYCPLGKAGSLLISNTPASYLPAEKKMAAPAVSIQFSSSSLNEDELIEFISRRDACSLESAGQAFAGFSRSLLSLSGTGELTVPGIGRFFAGPSGALQFREQHLPDAFRPSVPAEKVIRANSFHTILVGEKETTSSVMAERLQKNGQKTSSFFRYASWVLVILSSGLIIWYVSQYGFSSRFGNRMPLKTHVPAPGYQTSQ